MAQRHSGRAPVGPGAGPGRGARRSAEQTRDHVLGVASELFYWHGIRATGVDTVAASAGVTAPTLYRLFESKDGLVAAYLRRNDERYRAWLSAATAAAVGSPRERIMALFDALDEQVQPERCRGCPYLMALTEYPDPGSSVHQLAVATKAWVRSHVTGLVRELATVQAVAEPDLLADQLALLVEGVYASVQALGVDGPARHAARTAAVLIDAASA